MHFNVPHKTSAPHAVARIKTALLKHRAEIAQHAEITREEWEGNNLAFAVKLQGKTITGTLTVTDTEYVIDAQLPLLWKMFESKIEKEIAKQVEGIL